MRENPVDRQHLDGAPDGVAELDAAVPAGWFRALYETPLLLCVILDRQGRVLDGNHPAIEGAGLARADVLGREFADGGWWARDPHVCGNVRTWCRTALRTGTPVRTTTRYYLGDGEPRMADLALHPVRDDHGSVSHLVVTGLDITAVLTAERERDERVGAQAAAVRQVAEAREREFESARRAERRADERLNRLAVVALELLSAETLDDLTRIVVDSAMPVLGGDGGALIVADGERLRLAVSERLGEQVAVTYDDLPFDSPLPGAYTARTGLPLLLPDRTAGLEFTPAMAEVYDLTGRDAWAFLPLRVGTRLLGALAVSWPDERVFAPDEITMLEAVAAQCAQALDRIQHLRAQRESALARQRLSEALQRSLLTQPPTSGLLDIAVRYQPAAHEAHVGGDWYDAFETANGATVLVVGDVTGHDRVAVAAMGQLRNLLRGLAHDSDDHPATLLTRLDRAMKGLQVGALATAVLVRLEAGRPGTPTQLLYWSNAGHPPPLLRHPDGTVQVLHSHDLLLGVNPAAPRHDSSLELHAGSTLVLYSDGLIERRTGVLDEGITELSEVLRQVGDTSAEKVCDLLLGVAPADHSDDIALLVMRCG
ncbi:MULTISPECIES: SpoIIE family protein phosphatase [Micromonospora]|uniref:SpoIIE family protein phosphatase n=1 Tax=Micromonospora TaxID=1873 RepID=UPI0015863FB0|nr:SpoIIE family protein phosphatase [Micromonospora yangpuensis]